MQTKTTITWRDDGIRERVTVLTSGAGVTPDLTLAALRAISNAVVTSHHTGDVQVTDAPLASSATFPDLSDSWVITCQDAGNFQTQNYVPAPLQAAALADGVNADMVTSQWIALEDALPAAAVPYTGADISQIVAAGIVRDSEGVFQTYVNFDSGTDWARRTIQWSGIHGTYRLTHLVGLTDSLGSDFDMLMSAMLGVSAAVVTQYWEGPMFVYEDSPTTDQYNSVRDYCSITFADSVGDLSEIVLPAPFRAIFLADGKTLDLSNGDVMTLINAVTTELIVPSSGQPIVSCVGGQLAKQSVS